MGRKRYTHVLGRTYILIRSRVLWPVVLVDAVGYALRRLYRAVVRPATLGEEPQEVRSILAIRLDHIGDVLLTTPALTLLKRRFPQARITCLVGSWSADILRGNPAVDEVLGFDASWFGGPRPSLGRLRKLVELVRSLRARRFDVVIDFRGDLRHLVVGRLVGRRLYGYGIRGGGFLLDAELEPNETAHESERYVELARLVAGDELPAGPLRIALSETDRREARQLFEELALDRSRLVVALCPVSRNPTRWWMPERFAAVSRHLRQRHDAQILVFAASSSADYVERMLGDGLEGVHNVVGRTSLRGFAAALELVDCIISVESSPIHFASALGKPIVTLFGGTSLPRHWAPHAVPHRIVTRQVECAPCFSVSCPLERVLCLEAIEVDDVIRAFEDLLAEQATLEPEVAGKLRDRP